MDGYRFTFDSQSNEYKTGNAFSLYFDAIHEVFLISSLVRLVEVIEIMWPPLT